MHLPSGSSDSNTLDEQATFEGGLTLRPRAWTKLLEILETHQPEPLPPEVLKEMDNQLETAE